MKKLCTSTWLGLAEDLRPLETWPKWVGPLCSLIVIGYRDQPAPPGQSHRPRRLLSFSVFQTTVDTDLVGPRWGAWPSWNLPIVGWPTGYWLWPAPPRPANAQPALPSQAKTLGYVCFLSMKKLCSRTWLGLAEDLCPLETWPKWVGPLCSLIVIRYRDQPVPPGESHRLRRLLSFSVFQTTVDTDLVGPRWGAWPSWNLPKVGWPTRYWLWPAPFQDQPTLSQPSHPRPKPSAMFASPSMKKLCTRTWLGLAEDLRPLETWPKWVGPLCSLIVIGYRDQPANPGQSHRLGRLLSFSVFQTTVDTDLVGPRWGAWPSWNLPKVGWPTGYWLWPALR